MSAADVKRYGGFIDKDSHITNCASLMVDGNADAECMDRYGRCVWSVCEGIAGVIKKVHMSVVIDRIYHLVFPKR